jgi:hypothetical protein
MDQLAQMHSDERFANHQTGAELKKVFEETKAIIDRDQLKDASLMPDNPPKNYGVKTPAAVGRSSANPVKTCSAAHYGPVEI